MGSARGRLLHRCFWISLLAVAVGTALLTASNVFINGSEIAYLLTFNIPAILAGNLIVIAALLGFAYRWIGGATDGSEAQLRYESLPGKMLAGTLSLSAVLSVLYHISELAFFGRLSRISKTTLINITGSLITEMTIALIIGMLIYALCRRAVRPHLVRLGAERRPPGRRATLLVPLAAASIGCFFIMAVAGVDFAMSLKYGETGIWDLAAVLAVRGTFCLAVFSLIAFEVRGDVRTALSHLGALLREGATASRRPIPVVASDEIGELTESFNRLQRHMRKASEEMRKELSLAYQVQKRLLPAASCTFGAFELAAASAPSREVGGDLFDIVERGQGGFAVMVGDVSGKGMPASMLMTATLALFRKEVRNGATPAQTLSRLNAAFAETLQGRMYVTMVVGFWDPEREALRYASAGHLAPYVLRGGRAAELDVPAALPLGIDPEETYREAQAALRPGDRLLMYTDGIVEAERDDGGMLGFEGLEGLLEELPAEESAAAALLRLTARLPAPKNGAYDDDRTMLLLRYAGAVAGPAAADEGGAAS